MTTRLIASMLTTLIVSAASGVTVRGAQQPITARQAVEKALPLLQESARTWTRDGKCFSCHHQGIGASTVAVARERGFRIDNEKFTAEVTTIRRQLAPPEVVVSFPPNAVYLDDSLALVALAASGAGRDAATDREIYRLLASQHATGHWTPYPLRLPLEGSLFSHTAWAIRALQLFAPVGRKSEAESRVKRAMNWMNRQTPIETQDVSMQLLALGWTGARTDRVQRAANQLLSLQNTDGGWSQIPARPSDAYATGQALVALNQAGRVSSSSESFKKGVAFLTRSQHPDGSWLVETRRTWKRGLPYFESGFPHGKHQFISYAGTAWATMALALADRNARSAVIMGDPRRTTTSLPYSETSALTPLMQAALTGSHDELRALLRKQPDVNAVAAPSGVTALMCAAHDPAKVAMLLEVGAKVGTATAQGHTALVVAADYDGAAESVKLLLEHGADPNARTLARMSTPLARAILRGDRRVAEMLLAAGAAVNDQPQGSSALMAAVIQRDMDLVEFLLDRGANLESQNTAEAPLSNGGNRQTPLMLAADRSAVDLVGLLLRRGADVNARDLQGMTPLMYAAGAIDLGTPTTTVVEMLVKAKADLSVRTPSGDSALDFATRYGKTAVTTLLREASPAR